MAPPRRALIAVTSAKSTLPSGDGHRHTTGLFVAEALHPFKVLRSAGFQVDLSSETGTYTADDLSLTPDFLNGKDLEEWNDPSSEFRQKLDNMPKASELDPSAYGVFFASAGHASLIDYPTAENLKKVAATVWKNGGVVSSVCHGPAIFQNLFDLDTKEPLIKGKNITGFTTEAEDVLGATPDLRSWNAEMVEETAEKMGANYKRANGVWDDYHVIDGRLVTGQNPASSTSTAKAVVQVFDKL